MRKSDAIKLFKSQAAIGRAMNVSRAAISSWPEDLQQWQIDALTGAAMRMGLIKPPHANIRQSKPAKIWLEKYFAER